MNGEVYLSEDARGWLAIHESESGDSSGMEGPFPSYPRAERAAKDFAARLGAVYAPDRAKLTSIATALLDHTLSRFRRDEP